MPFLPSPAGIKPVTPVLSR